MQTKGNRNETIYTVLSQSCLLMATVTDTGGGRTSLCIYSCCPLVREESAGTTAWRQWSRSPADLRTKPAGNSTALFPLHTTSWIFYAMLKQTACLLPASQKTKNFSGTFYCKDSIKPFSEVAKCMLKCDHLPGSCIILCPHV